MIDPDIALKILGEIYTDFGDFCKNRGQVTESDTRAKIIDRIIKEVLGWPESSIEREPPVHHGYIDYLLSHAGKRNLVIESKREGISFDVPITQFSRKKYKISGAIKTNKAIKEAIEQAQKYSVDAGTKYAVVTNGYAWLIFKAYIENDSWLNGHIFVFPSAGYIKSNFIEFWNILSFPAVTNGSLYGLFSSKLSNPRLLVRPIDLLNNPDAPLNRNRFHTQLNPFVEGVFRDIGAAENIDILQKCYVYNKYLKFIDADLKFVIEDSIPPFIEADGGVEVSSGKYDSGILGIAVQDAVTTGAGKLFLLLGGIGSGKTTFINRFFRYIGKSFIDKNALWYYVDFLTAPPNQSDVELFLYNSILRQMRENYEYLKLESRDSLKIAYEDLIKIKRESILDAEGLSPIEYERRLSNYLEHWMEKVTEYVPRLSKSALRHGRTNILCIDNVDQLAPDYQAKIFLLAQRAAREMQAVVIIALREESYYAASIQRAFTAYNNRKFHIASPPFRFLISRRLKYCREMLDLPPNEIVIRLGSEIHFDKTAISKFLDIIEYSIFSYNKNISRLIEALAFGNMREALDMFATFLYSGATNVDKMLKIYDRDGQYFVAFHEFAKSVILGDRRYYRDSESKILNLFDCGQDSNSSHFTSIRILSLLVAHIQETSPEGRGFIRLDDLFMTFLDIFDNEQDLIKTIHRLLRRQLIQIDTRSTETIDGASYIRITSSGWYYIKYLCRAFAYLDLVFQDTPINDSELAYKLRQWVIDLDSLPDTQNHISERLSIRFDRVDAFLNYLYDEEQIEYKKYSLNKNKGILGELFIPDIKEQYLRERSWIDHRVREKAERQPDDQLTLDEKMPDFPLTENIEEEETS